MLRGFSSARNDSKRHFTGYAARASKQR